MSSRYVVALALALATSGCGTTVLRAPAARPESPLTSHTTLIEASELRASREQNLYDAIAHARPLFLATRGASSILAEPATPIVVVIDRQIYGGLEVLRMYDARQIYRVRRLSASDVFQMTGHNAPSGGIELQFFSP